MIVGIRSTAFHLSYTFGKELCRTVFPMSQQEQEEEEEEEEPNQNKPEGSILEVLNLTYRLIPSPLPHVKPTLTLLPPC